MKRLVMIAAAACALALAGCGSSHAKDACAGGFKQMISVACLEQEHHAEQQRQREGGEREATLARKYEEGSQ